MCSPSPADRCMDVDHGLHYHTPHSNYSSKAKNFNTALHLPRLYLYTSEGTSDLLELLS